MSLAEEEAWFEAMKKRSPRERPLAIDVHQDKDWIHVGGTGLFDFDDRARSAELGITVGNKVYWDQGVGSEALRVLMNFGFNTLNLRRISLRVFEYNPRAIHVYQKLGFIEEGRLRQSVFHDGKYYDTILMSILKSEFSGREDQDG
jgi:RimJ/RimL family protein N-acetyltransferase